MAAVILSGLGSDGAAALKTIKALGGVTFAQNPDSAQYPSMPQCAIETGFVDFVVSPEGIAMQLVSIARGMSKAATATG